MSPYNYSVLEFILKKLYQTKVYRDEKPQFLMKADKILGFLMQYQRVSEPQAECEVDSWIKERGCPLPSLAMTRLPLYSLVMLPAKEKYKWLEKEFTLDTYKSWMSVAKVLGLKGDNICYFAVKNTVCNMLEMNAKEGMAGDDWIIGHVNKNILENIETCIRSMTDCEKATAACNWVVNRLPRGKDKVMASVGAENIVQSWCSSMTGDSLNDTVVSGLDLTKKTRKQLETEECLHKHRLSQQKYLDLVHQDKPLELILKLYEDPSIETRNTAAAGNFPDINTAVETVARIHEINIVKVRHDLLDKWLPVNTCSGFSSHDDTMTDFTLNLNTFKQDSESNTDDINLLRCVYMLQTSEHTGLQYLLKFGFSDEPAVSTHHKLRALKCLFSICSDEKLISVTGKTVEEVKQYMKTLVILSRLESLHLPYTLQNLEQFSKSSLVESVWKVGKQSAEGVVLVRDLCSEYQIWTPTQWSALLDRMCSLGMHSDLSTTLITLNSHPQLWNSPQYLRAWNMVLQSPLSSAVPPLNQEQLLQCQQSFKLIHFCPTATDLDLRTLGNKQT